MSACISVSNARRQAFVRFLQENGCTDFNETIIQTYSKFFSVPVKGDTSLLYINYFLTYTTMYRESIVMYNIDVEFAMETSVLRFPEPEKVVWNISVCIFVDLVDVVVWQKASAKAIKPILLRLSQQLYFWSE